MLKRVVIGSPVRSEQAGHSLLPKRLALPIFASDALSSVAYAPDEIFIMLSVAGVSAYAFSWKIALAVSVVMLTVVASYRQNVHAYPSGGGDYEVAKVNLGNRAGMTVASALSGFTFCFDLLAGAGVLLFLIAPLINRLMHGVK